MKRLVKQFLEDRRGSLQVTVFASVIIFATFIVWLATFGPVFMVIDQLVTLVNAPQLTNIVRLCNIAAGLCLICEIVACLIWAVASSFKREAQTFGGDF